MAKDHHIGVVGFLWTGCSVFSLYISGEDGESDGSLASWWIFLILAIVRSTLSDIS
jgi:hypothetical protein